MPSGMTGIIIHGIDLKQGIFIFLFDAIENKATGVQDVHLCIYVNLPERKSHKSPASRKRPGNLTCFFEFQMKILKD